MSNGDDAVLAEAVRWHLASERDDMDWDAFTRWLEADPRHRRVFDEVALTGAMLGEYASGLPEESTGAMLMPANDEDDEPIVARPRPGARWRWGGFAIAASLAALVAVPQMLSPAAQVYATQGDARRVALLDGSSVLLAPRSRLSVEGRGQERMTLSGGAIFDIRHDPARQLEISAGSVTITDIGTRFDVQAEGHAVRVAVVEGRVEVSADALTDPVRLDAGRGLAFDGEAGTATVAAVKAADVGAWQDGRLSYENAPLALVVADLRRYAGVTVDVPAHLRDRRFSGTLIVDDGDAALRDLVQLMGLRLGGSHGAWTVEPR